MLGSRGPASLIGSASRRGVLGYMVCSSCMPAAQARRASRTGVLGYMALQLMHASGPGTVEQCGLIPPEGCLLPTPYPAMAVTTCDLASQRQR